MIDVLIVDDSAFMRQVFKNEINKESNLNVIAVARNGRDALKKIEKYKPDVITMDIEMPEISGLELLKILMNKKDFNTPVIMVSAMDDQSNVIDALDLGAFDFLPKPSGNISLDISEIIDDLIKKINAAYSSNLNYKKIKCNKKADNKINKTEIDNFPIIAVGTSSGGPKALKEFLPVIPKDIPAGIIIVQHMPEGFTKTLAKRMNKISHIEIKEAKNGDKIQRGKALIAPGNYHLEIIEGEVKLNQKDKKWGVRPCVDYMMKTTAKYYKDRVIGVILTGMGRDGAEGMQEIQNHNGYGIVQDRETSLVYGMPQATINIKAYQDICALNKIPEKIIEVIERKF